MGVGGDGRPWSSPASSLPRPLLAPCLAIAGICCGDWHRRWPAALLAEAGEPLTAARGLVVDLGGGDGVVRRHGSCRRPSRIRFSRVVGERLGELSRSDRGPAGDDDLPGTRAGLRPGSSGLRRPGVRRDGRRGPRARGPILVPLPAGRGGRDCRTDRRFTLDAWSSRSPGSMRTRGRSRCWNSPSSPRPRASGQRWSGRSRSLR